MNITGLRDAVAGSRGIVRRGWSLLAIAFLVDSAFLFVFLIALQTYLPESLHRSDAIAGWTLGTFATAKLLTQLAGGFVADRLGGRRAMALGTAFLLAGEAAILPLAHVAPWVIVGAGVFVGLGSSLTWPALYAEGGARFHDREKGRFTALLTLCSGGALLVGLGAGTLLEAFARFDVAMALPIGSVGAAFAMSMLMRGDGARVERELTLPSLSEARGLFMERRRLAFAALVLAEAAAIGALTAAFRAYGRDVLGGSLTREAALLVPAAVFGGLLVIPGGALADRIGRRRVLAPGFATTGACLLVLSRVSDPAVVIALGGIAGGAFGLAIPAVAATMMSIAGASDSRGGLIGWFMMMDGIGHAAGPALAAMLVAWFDAGAVLIAAGGLFGAAGAIALASHLGDARLAALPAELEAQAA